MCLSELIANRRFLTLTPLSEVPTLSSHSRMSFQGSSATMMSHEPNLMDYLNDNYIFECDQMKEKLLYWET